jgi:hypothetical protein
MAAILLLDSSRGRETAHGRREFGDQGFTGDMRKRRAYQSATGQARADQPRETTLPLFVKCTVVPPF